VLGITLEGQVKHFNFTDLAANPVTYVKTSGDDDVVIVFLTDMNTVSCFRAVDNGRLLSLELRDDNLLTDKATGTFWDPITGQGVSGPLREKPLEPVAATVTYQRDWETFFPNSKLQQP